MAASRVAVVLLAGVAALVAWQMDSIQRGWIYIIELTAGIALVWLLRWYWWRVNAWAEIAAMAGSVALANTRVLLGLIEPVVPTPVLQAVDAMYAPGMDLVRGVAILIVCTVLWVVVALATRPESDEVLDRFYRRVHPGGWWDRVARGAGVTSNDPSAARMWLGFLLGGALRLRQPARRRLSAHREDHRGHAPRRRLAGRGSPRRAQRPRQRRRDAGGSLRPVKVVLVGAGSREFGPASIRDLLLSDPLCDRGLDIVLMDLDASELPRMRAYAESVAERLGRAPRLSATTRLADALPGADAVVMAIELNRYFHWAQDFHIPRTFGFPQIYGENGGPGGLFHALRNMGPCVEVARAMEAHCPDAWLLNYTNPLTKLCEAQSRLTEVRVVGLCHGVFHGIEQMARLLELPVARVEARASGINHFTWFESVRDRETGEDLYPRLKRREREAHLLHDWDEIALSRILLRVFGPLPEPRRQPHRRVPGVGAGVSRQQRAPVLLRSRRGRPVGDGRRADLDLQPRRPSHGHARVSGGADAPREADPGAEGRCGRGAGRRAREEDPGTMPEAGRGPRRRRAADPPPRVNRTFQTSWRPPASWRSRCSRACSAASIPVSTRSTYRIGNTCRVSPKAPWSRCRRARTRAGSIRGGCGGCPRGSCRCCAPRPASTGSSWTPFAGGSRRTLLQALMLDPTTHSYRAAVNLVNEMFRVQGDVLPEMKW